MNTEQRQAALAAMRQGDIRQLGPVLDSFRPYLRVVVRAAWDERLNGRFDDSDLIQEALAVAGRSFEKFRGESVQEFAGWLRQIAIYCTRNTIRRTLGVAGRDVGREVAVENLDQFIDEANADPSRRVIDNEESFVIADALAGLPEPMQEVLLARLVDGLSHAEIAVKLNRSDGAVRVLYLRALRRLRDCLRESDHGPN